MDAQCDKLTTIVASKVDRHNYLFISRVLNEKKIRGFLSGVRDSTGILLILLTDLASR